MSDGISDWYDDMNAYEDRCKYFGEKVQLDRNGYPDCLGPHDRELQRRLVTCLNCGRRLTEHAPGTKKCLFGSGVLKLPARES